MSLNSIVELIKNAKFEIIIQNEEEYLKCIKSGKEVEHILGVCSHVIFNTGTFPNGVLSSMSKMVIFHLQRAANKLFEINSLNVLKHLYYILVHGVRKGLDMHAALNLIKEIESLLTSCQEFSINHPDLLKKMHSTLWNVSLQKGMRPDDALVLQGHALGFLSLVSESFHDSCIFTNRVGKLAEHNKCSIQNIENLYRKILTALISTLKRKPVISSASVIAVNQILIEFARTLYVNKKCNEYSKIFKPLVISLEALCDLKVILSLKMSVKIVEVGITFASDQSNKETLLKFLSGCSVVSKSSSEANTILVDGLYFIYQLFQEKKTYSKTSEVVTSIFRCITDRIKPESNFSNDTLLRILDLYGTHLNNYVTLITENNDDKETLITEAGKCSSALSNLMDKVGNLVGETQVYNIGINSFNLGVIAFKNKNYDIASELLDFGVKYLFANYSMCNESQKNSIMSIIKKKAILLKDSLRYSGKFKEAATKTLLLVALNILPLEEFSSTWSKCKRDAQKLNCLSFQKISLVDIYDEVQSELSDSNKLTIKVEELLLATIRELELGSFDTCDEQINCAVALMNSNVPKFSIDGTIAYAILLWSNPEKRTDESSVMNVLKKAFIMTEKTYTKNENVIALEYKAEIEFWMYLSNLQIIQEKAELEIEETLKENEPLTVQSTDLGEEVQPNDVCSVRPSTTVNTFDCQENNSQHLHQSLDYWEQVVKGRKVRKPSVACSNLMSIGFIYKLNGVLPSFIKAFTFLLQVANLYDHEEYWIQGVIELIDIIPELLSIKIAQRLLDLLKSEASKAKSKVTEYLRLSTLSSVAYLYYRKGMYSDGAVLVNECLSNPIMNKRTPSATEVQIGVYVVASYYAFLPKPFLPTDLRPKENCLFLALNATRKAIGLVNASADFNNGIICWRHKVAWLHHNANMWLGRLCYITAQPRLARAYLRQSLSLAEKFALPLRTAELFCTLAEIDLQCDQLDDCRVKIDSVDSLLKIHSFDTRESFSLENDLKKDKHSMQMGSCGQSELKSTISIYIDDSSVDENMRDGKVSPGFVLPEPTLHLGNQLPAHGVKKGIDLLQKRKNCPPSPSSEKFVVRSVHSCPKGVGNCCLCMTPELHSVSVRANVLMGIIYAQRDNEKESQRCFTQALKDLEQVLNSCSEIVSSLCSILKLNSTDGTCFVNDKEDEKDQFIRILMSQASLSLLFNHNEILCLSQSYWDSMESKALETLRTVNEQSPMILTLNHPLVLQLILQCHAISRTVRSREERTEISPIETECSPFNPSKTEALSFKTPLKSCSQKKFNPFLSVSKEQQTFTPFKIFTDESDSSSSGEKNNLKKGAKVRKEKEIKNLASSFEKLSVETNAPYCKLNFSGASTTTSPSFSPLGSQNKSPFSQALELPSRKPVKATGDETSTLTSKTKLKKLISKNPRSSGEIPSPEEIKENSLPIIKSKLPRRGRPTSTTTASTTTTTQTVKTKTFAAPSATATRETRSRRNLKRL